jgi:hypothetical protein
VDFIVISDNCWKLATVASVLIPAVCSFKTRSSDFAVKFKKGVDEGKLRPLSKNTKKHFAILKHVLLQKRININAYYFRITKFTYSVRKKGLRS